MNRQEEKALEYQNANLNTAPYDAFLDGYQYAIPEVCHIIRMIYIQNGNKLPSDFEDIVNHRMKML